MKDWTDESTQSGNVPPAQHGGWRIELRYLPIAHRGHAFLQLIDPYGNPAGQLHGLAQSRATGKIVDFGMDGSRLVGTSPDREMPPEKTVKIGDVASGTYDEMVGDKWKRALRAADEINRRNLDYKSDDASYELIGGDGGQIQNSNSAAYTFGKAMDLDLDSAMREQGLERRFPGWGRNLLDPGYQPYVAPPQFPNNNAP